MNPSPQTKLGGDAPGQSDRQTYRQTDSADRQTDRQADKLTVRPAALVLHWQTPKLSIVDLLPLFNTTAGRCTSRTPHPAPLNPG